MDSVKSETYLQNINKNQNTIHPPIKKKLFKKKNFTNSYIA